MVLKLLQARPLANGELPGLSSHDDTAPARHSTKEASPARARFMHIGINLPAKFGLPVSAALSQYDFITQRITTSGFRKRNDQTMHAADIALDPLAVAQTVALGAPWAEIDAKDPVTANNAKSVLKQELEHAAFCGVQNVVVPGPRRRTHLARYAQTLQALLSCAPSVTLLLHTTPVEDGSPSDYFSTWHVWESVRALVNSPRLRLLLEIPATPLPQALVNRWACEDVAMVVLSAHLFVPNAKNYPVLPKHIQQMVLHLADLVLVKDAAQEDHLIYLRHLVAKREPIPPLADVLQLPLEPQRNFLESATYDIFEQDSYKYAQYQRAIEDFLRDRAEPTVVLVAGAGRGGLVRCTLAASTSTGVPVTVHAVERNPSAYLTLEASKTVKTHLGDVRDFSLEHDLVVSEMLGSFGDNELAPEIMGGFIAPQIPASHSSFIQPYFSPKLFAETQKHGLKLYVVNIHQGQAISEPQRAWTFDYSALELEQSTKLTFTSAFASTLHGFSGTFEAKLRNNHKISTASTSSWFPLWFPLDQPLMVPQGGEIEFSLWRSSGNKTTVEYQWCVEVFMRGSNRRRLSGTRIFSCNV